MKKNKLYAILAIACFFGYLWLGYSIYHFGSTDDSGFNACFFKQVTTFPCPSCGTSRAIVLLLKGDFGASVMMNPFGLIVAFGMLVIPAWLLFDTITGKQTFFDNYKKAETIIKIKWIAIVLVLLVLANWIWNIHKQL